MKVLDHGFVELLDVMPYVGSGDAAIVEAARCSVQGESKGEEADKKLLQRLYRDKHTSPFEMVEFKFRCKLPIFIARQWIRHRTANVNEWSARYSELCDEFYIRDAAHYQSKSNKQGRGDVHPDSDAYTRELINHSRESYSIYKYWLSRGVAREEAREFLPPNIYTIWIWKIDLHNLLNFLRLRLHPHAQWEIQEYARAMKTLIIPKVPWTMEMFDAEFENTLRAIASASLAGGDKPQDQGPQVQTI